MRARIFIYGAEFYKAAGEFIPFNKDTAWIIPIKVCPIFEFEIRVTRLLVTHFISYIEEKFKMTKNIHFE
ncbi:hypothetical protein HM131_18220 [Halobacillus mangrovi]|uniref:Uncharacterized protein n=1 Tax=Halobacillus mangrovi TaxID=402384 RepID=A0A1W5ZZ81_9BACI|nr:hypothetical protein HM131_18220 [Halobacillus mangrovi]